MNEWQCPWCHHYNGPDRTAYCGHCYNGRTLAIENAGRAKVGLPPTTAQQLRRTRRA